jgi:hypothetical protein
MVEIQAEAKQRIQARRGWWQVELARGALQSAERGGGVQRKPVCGAVQFERGERRREKGSHTPADT